MASENASELDAKNHEKNEVLLHEGDGFMCTETLTKCKNSVCFIRCETDRPTPQIKRGTGFYAKAKIFGIDHCCIVTNYHVLSCEADARAACAIFNFEGENPGVQVQLRPDKIFRTNQELDYTVVGVNEEELERLHPPVYPLHYTEQPAAQVGDDVFIFQHPKGTPKQFSYEKIIRIEPPYVLYSADTDEGSSGSPVLRKLCLMAVHHKGSEEWNYNKGTLFSEIINDLHSGFSPCKSVNFTDASGKRGLSIDETDSLVEMEENSWKKLCVESSKNHTSAIIHDEKPPLCPDDKLLDKLSHECSGFYKHLGRRLEVENVKIEEISKDHINYGSNPEKCFQVLQEWKQSEACSFTLEKLGQALRSLNKNALANKYCAGPFNN